MSLSFSDSLKNVTQKTSSNDDLSVASVMSLSLDNAGIAVQSFNESGWIKVTDKDYRFYDNDYSDDSYSTVDESKNISLDSKQINITQEQNSQYIPFKMPRYYDGFDLVKTKLEIFYLNENQESHSDVPVDVYYNDEYIRFAWLVSEFATQVAGVLKFEIWAKGVNEKGETYVWKSKSIDKLNVLQSLQNVATGEIGLSEEEIQTWYNKIQLESQSASAAAVSAQASATEAANLVSGLQDGIADEVNAAVDEKVGTVVDEKITTKLENYYTKAETYSQDEVETKLTTLNTSLKTYTDEAVDNIDLTSVIDDYATKDYVTEAIAKADISDKLNNYYTKDEAYNKDEVDALIANQDISDKLNDYYTKYETYNKEEVEDLVNNATPNMDGYATEIYVDNKVASLSSSIETNSTSISSLSTTVGELQEVVGSIDTSPRLTYDVAYNDIEDEDVGENVFVFYEIENEGTEGEIKTAKQKFTIVGGSGGSASSSSLKISYVTTSPLVVTTNDSAIITYNFSGTDSSGDDIPEGTYTWKIGTKMIATGTAINGENTFDATDYISVGTQKLTLSIVDDAGSLVTKSWTVQKVDVRIESTFNDAVTYPIGDVSFSYTPYGAIDKTVHFILDGIELTRVNTKVSGVPMSYTLLSQKHGSHLLEIYITAELNGNTIETNHIYKDIIWYDSTSNVPVIGCTQQNITAKQYDSTSITYTVYDPDTETPTVILAVDGNVVSTLTLDSITNVWQYKSSEIGDHVLTITCGETVKTINVTVVELGIEITPVTAGLEFDFDPIGYSNSDADRLWSDGDVVMTVSDNFDWTNGGYQIDDNGDQYFCVKAGTTATINYNLFADDPKRNGKEFKVVFKTTNVKNRDTSFISCMDNNIGLDMKVESANIYSSNDSLYSPYCEDDIIEFEFNINKDTDIPMVLTYEDGVANRPMIYTTDASFMQTTHQPITIGSADCDIHIYRMKVYSNSLSDSDILSNFIADARNAEEMVSRYNRNQIYDENGLLTPEVLAEKCPDLRIIMVDCPRFTTDKSDKVSGTNITMIYKNGDPILDNWTCTGAKVSGQGTSSNEYGYAGRNLDLIMDGDDALFTLGDGETTSKAISLTRDSTPTDYLNFKCNIASSENQNNALMTMRFNEYQPYIRPARLRDSKIRDCMEFHNAVCFVREYNEDLSTHNEFTDCEWHKIA